MEISFIDDQNVLHILGEKVFPNSSITLNLISTKLYTNSSVKLPIFIERAQEKGPVILITSGIHGDEVNGIEIVRQLIENKINKPKIGTIICIPILNILGFTSKNRTFPDNRDLNRVFPGSKTGSLASRVAFQLVNEVLPVVNFVMDFHTGGGSRFNLPQVRIDPLNEELKKIAKIFNAPFTVESKIINGSFRGFCKKKSIPTLIFEGGKTNTISSQISKSGVEGTKRILAHYGMLLDKFNLEKVEDQSVIIKKTRWIRTKHSGLLHITKQHGSFVEKGEVIATITDPYGQFSRNIKCSLKGYIININEEALVFEGDAIFNISVE